MGQGLLGNPAYFVEKFPDFYFQSSAAFLDAVHHVALDACAVGFKQMTEEFHSIPLDDFSCADKTKNQVRQPSKRRRRLRDLDEIKEGKLRTNPKPCLCIQGVRHAA